MANLLDKLKVFFTTNNNWNVLTKKKVDIFTSVRTEDDPNELWEITEYIGDGAFGKIYKARNKESGILAALKQVNVDDESDLKQYSVEVNILSQFNHRNVVGMHEAFYYDSKIWMYLEYCSVGAVDNVMQELEHGLSESLIKSISKQMCIGLNFLHNNNVIHRDLKAGNVLLTNDAIVKLADFGVSAKCSDHDEKRNTFIGTPHWMAPEVFACETSKEDPYDLKADIWSFGITIIEFAQMNPPFSKVNPGRLAIKIMRGDPPTFDVPSKWSSEFNDFLSKCLQKNPNQRFLTSQLLEHSFLSDVDEVLPIMQLISELKADVTIELRDVDSRDNLNVLPLDSNSKDELLTTLSYSPTDDVTDMQLENCMNGESRTSPNEIEKNGKSCEQMKKNYEVEIEKENDSHNSTSFVASNSISKNKRKKEKYNFDDFDKLVEEEVQEISVAIAEDFVRDLESTNERQANDTYDGWPSVFAGSSMLSTKQTGLQTTAYHHHHHDATATDNNFMIRSPERHDYEMSFDRDQSHYRSLTKIRSYVYEGKMITSQTSKVVLSGNENREQEEHETRKANMRALKVLQFTENRQQQELNQRFKYQRENIERQFHQDLRECLKRYSSESELLSKQHKQEIEKLEDKQSMEFRTFSRNIKDEQDKNLKSFQDNLKRELRLTKRENNANPKNIQRRQLEQKEVECAEMERKYREHQSEMSRNALHHLTSMHRSQMSELESELLESKHQLLRTYEGRLWAFEEKRLNEKSELMRRQIKQTFELSKEQATFRHRQEVEHSDRTHERERVQLQQRLTADKKELSKVQKSETRRRQQMFKEALRMNPSNSNSEQEREKIKEFDENEKKRIKEQNIKLETKHNRHLEEFETNHGTFVAEMEQLNNERTKELNEQLNHRLNQEMSRCKEEITEWQLSLTSRKRVLEDEFAWQFIEQKCFYNQVYGINPPRLNVVSKHAQKEEEEGATVRWMMSESHVSTAL